MQRTPSSTQKSQKEFQTNYQRITLNIKPSMLLFLTHFEVNLEQHKHKPYMAKINYNVLNETTWINIVPTFMGDFCHNGDSKINTMPMEHMVHYACLIVGYHNKISLINPNEQRFPKWKTLFIMFSTFVKKSLTTCFFRTHFLTVKVQQRCIPFWNSQINRHRETRLWNHQPSLQLSWSFLGARCS